jgi:3D (Asp-Asp-Asp) domain-containing protein
MRIISAFVIFRIILALILPQTVEASEIEKTNETKINLKVQDSGVMNIALALEAKNIALLAYNPNDFKDIVPSEEDIKREKALARFEYQKKGARLPEGKFVVNASAYTAAADECGKSDGITASGLMVKENETIACPPTFPFGTKLQIDGMGTYVCQDRGGAIKGNHIDIYMETKSQAFSFGRRNLLAEVVK